MLTNLLSLCLLTLLSAGQNCVPRTTDLGEGSLGAGNDHVIQLDFYSGDRYNLAYDRQTDLVGLLYNAGGNFTYVRCHDLICENHTKTVLHAGGCQNSVCAAEFCRKQRSFVTPNETLVYHSPITQKTYAVVCNGTVCDDSVATEVGSGSTASLGCVLDDQERMLFAVPSYGVPNTLFRCGETCSSVEAFFEGSLALQVSRVAVVLLRFIEGHPGVVFMRSGKGTLYFVKSYDFPDICRCAFPVLLAEGVVDTPFAVQTRYYNAYDWVQVSYVASHNGVMSLYLVSCRNSFHYCVELRTNLIDPLLYEVPMPSVSYNRQRNPVIAYRARDAQGVWYVKIAYCFDFVCNQFNVSALPQDDVVHGVSLEINENTGDLYLLYDVGQTPRVKLYTCLESIDTPYPSRSPSQKPTLTPSAPTPSPTSDPSLSPVFSTGDPTMVTDTPTSTPTGVPTKNPTPCRYPTVENAQKEKKNPCASKLTAVWVINSMLALGNVIAAMYRYEWIAKWLYRCQDRRNMKNMQKNVA